MLSPTRTELAIAADRSVTGTATEPLGKLATISSGPLAGAGAVIEPKTSKTASAAEAEPRMRRCRLIHRLYEVVPELELDSDFLGADFSAAGFTAGVVSVFGVAVVVAELSVDRESVR
jgi:hypothetical protein